MSSIETPDQFRLNPDDPTPALRAARSLGDKFPDLVGVLVVTLEPDGKMSIGVCGADDAEAMAPLIKVGAAARDSMIEMKSKQDAT